MSNKEEDSLAKAIYTDNEMEKKKKEKLQKIIAELGIEKYAKELDEEGYTVVPPSVTGVSEEMVDDLVAGLFERSEELIPGVKMSVDMKGNEAFDYGDHKGKFAQISKVKPSQFFLVQLTTYKRRSFRDLAINPVATALIENMIGYGETRFSSHSAFLKWKGDGYGDSLGLHCDQTALPYPWSPDVAYNANTNWW